MAFSKGGASAKKAKLLWGGLLFLCLCLCAGAAGYSLIVNKHQRVENAVAASQRATFLLRTGEVLEGNMLSDRLAADAEPPELVQNTLQEKATEPQPEVKSQLEEKPEQKTEPEAVAAVPEAVKSEQAQQIPEKGGNQEVSQEEDTKVPAQASEYDHPVAKVKVAVLVGGLGLSNATTERALALPANITLGFSPYAHNIPEWFAKAKASGHEVLVDVPMEPENYPTDDPGPFALLTELGAEKNMKRLNWILSRGDGYAGVYTEPDEKFTESRDGMGYIIDALRQKGKLLVYGKGYQNNAFLQLAGGKQMPLLVSDLVIDRRISANAIDGNLQKLEEMAKKNGYALGMGSPYPITIQLLEKWLTTLDQKGIQLAPVSQLQNK